MPQDVFVAAGRRRRRRRGAARAADRRRVLHRLVRDRRSASPRAVGPRMIKLQLELGGKDPTYVARRRRRRQGRGRVARRRRDLQHRPELLLGRAHLRARASPRRVRRRLRRRRRGLQGRRPDATRRPTSAPLTRAPQLDVLEAQVADAVAKGAKLLHRRQARSPQPGNWFAPTVLTDVDHRMAADARGELRPDHRHPEGRRRRRSGAP